MNKVFGKDTRYVSTIGLSQIAAAQFLHVYKPRHWINCGQAGPAGLDAFRQRSASAPPTPNARSSPSPAITISSS